MRCALPALMGLAALVSCSPERPRPADVLIVTIDTLRADRVGAYGHQRDTTPVLDSLAAEGTLFEIAYAPIGSTTPSHASLFTGRHPLSHGVTANGQSLPAEIETLAELASAAGWSTAAFVSSGMASSRWGLTRGFAHVDETLDRTEGQSGQPVSRSPTTAVDAALAWLDARPEGGPPVFLWLHLFDPHAPYEPPPAHAELFPVEGRGPRATARAAYEAEVHYSDAEFGRLLRRFDERPGEPLIVATSDHGEGLWDHGWPVHSRTTFEEELRIPLILRWRGELAAGARLAQPVAIADLAPTIAAAMKLPARPWESLDLTPWLFDGRAAEPKRELLLLRPLFAGGLDRPGEQGPGLALRSGALKVFVAPEEKRLELFDLLADPHERLDLADERPQEAQGLAARCLSLAAASRRRAPAAGPEDLSAEDLEQLRALGYVQ